MSVETEYLDNFFVQPDLLSNCCGALVTGELFKNFGRCSDCYEMAEFSTDNDERQIAADEAERDS